MPFAPPRHCPIAGHPPFTAKRCPLCSRAYERSRANPRRRGLYDADWQAVRAEVLRCHPVCATPGCGAPATQVDHVVPIKRGGARLDPRNLTALCKSCHSRKTALHDGRWGR